MKQQKMYESVTPLKIEEHKNLSVVKPSDFLFAKDLIAAPLTAVEFFKAVHEYVIVFAGTEQNLMPYVILGASEKKNLYIRDDGSFTAEYIPAYIRRYPFVFSTSDGGKNLTLCVDLEYKGCSMDGDGKKLFEEDGSHSDYLKDVMKFMTSYQGQYIRTAEFCKRIAELEILEPLTAQLKPEQGETVSLTGFYGVNREKMKNLSPEVLKELADGDGLELLYIHLLSMNNFNLLLEKIKNEQVVTQSA